MFGDFTKGESNAFEPMDGWAEGSPYDCGWYYDNCKFLNDAMGLTVDKDVSSKYCYGAGYYRSKAFYGYGTYEVEMKPIKNIGVVSSFFVMTNQQDNNPWDEIDIEFLGKDTNKVQFNYYTNGTGNHEKLYELGFDASKNYHFYSFRWEPNTITWYVDHKPVHTAKTNIPYTAGKIGMNVWPGTGVDVWLGAFDRTTPLTAYYRSVCYTPLTTPAPMEAPSIFAQIGDSEATINWSPSGDSSVIGYKLFQDDKEIATIPLRETSYVVKGLINGTNYHFKIVAFNANGNSNFSNTVSITPWWENLWELMENTPKGGKVTIDMKDNTELPKEALNLIQGKDVTIVLNMENGISWEINGKDVSNTADTNLEVKTNGEGIPIDVIDKITGEKKIVPFNLSFGDSLGFQATLYINLGIPFDGDYANVLLYNSTTNDLAPTYSTKIVNGVAKLVFSGAAKGVIAIDTRDYVGKTTTPPLAQPEQSYSIRYYLNKGINNTANPSSYTKSQKVMLKNSIRKGYAFKGWYKDSKFKIKIQKINKGTTGNYTLYAKWEKVKVSQVKTPKLINPKGKKLTVKYKKTTGVKGYEIICATNAKFKKNKKVIITSKTAATFTKLKKTTYFVKVRAYKLDSAGERVYGKYSKVKKIRVVG